MRVQQSRLSLVVMAATLVTTGCATAGPSSSPHLSNDPPSIAAPSGRVVTAGIVTVIDRGDGAQLCLGAVAASFPPQCGGPALVGWNWNDHDGQYTEAEGVRFGDFAVAGVFDLDEYTVDVAEIATTPLATDGEDSGGESGSAHGGGSGDGVPIEEVVAAAEAAGFRVNGFAGDASGQPAFLMVDYDDGTLQNYCDEVYGRGVIRVESALLPYPA